MAQGTRVKVGEWRWLGGDGYTQDGVAPYTRCASNQECATAWPPGSFDSNSFLSSGNNLFLFGGHLGNLRGATFSNEFWRFNLATGRWAYLRGMPTLNLTWSSPNLMEATPTCATPGSAESSTLFPGGGFSEGSAYDPDTNLYYLFGGRGFSCGTGAATSGTNFRRSNLWSYNVATGNWRYLYNGVNQASGNRINSPAGAGWPSLTMDPWTKTLYSYGGGAGTGVYMDDLWRWNITSASWSWQRGSGGLNSTAVYGSIGVESATALPSSRNAHSAFFDRTSRCLFIFGGQGYGVDAVNQVSIGFFNDLWRYNTSSSRWTWMSGSKVLNAPSVNGGIGYESTTYYPGARGRAARGSTFDETNRAFYLFGGETSSSAIYNDLWKYDIARNTWTLLGGSPDPFVPTSAPASVTGTRFTGGMYNQPAARLTPTMALNSATQELYLYGGGSSTTRFQDLWVYKLGVSFWVPPPSTTTITTTATPTDTVGTADTNFFTESTLIVVTLFGTIFLVMAVMLTATFLRGRLRKDAVEAMRDRERKVEAQLWATPVPMRLLANGPPRAIPEMYKMG